MTSTPPAILITVTGNREADRGVLVAWGDGVLVWSDNRLHGGPPYRVARVDPADIARTAAEMARAGRWVDEWRFGPDARWTRMTVHVGTERIIDVGSWHDIIEAVPGLVATATGIETLDGRSPAELLARQPPDYRAFRSSWDVVKDAASRLIPASGRPAEPADAAHMPWHTSGDHFGAD